VTLSVSRDITMPYINVTISEFEGKYRRSSSLK